jgi:hypothetical protein
MARELQVPDTCAVSTPIVSPVGEAVLTTYAEFGEQ